MFVLPFFLFSFSPSIIHPFHTSLTQMEFDPQRQTFEISLRLFTDDFETALTKENGGKSVHLNTSQKQDKLVEQYVRKHFAVANADRKLNPITYVGYEQEADAQWIYLEMPYSAKTQNIFIKQDILIELFTDQVNLVTIQLNQVKKTVVFRNNQPVQAVTI
ncbi:hypothetical protein J2I47_22905 [Fibrella sp. HMF5335]|uniref:Peptidase E n=1 Tax=Fibrella rubiginis TaxID=2817060 RepID=A0A939GHS7_9BACT|nr:hypothetical protein [Fibrella rubiginis]